MLCDISTWNANVFFELGIRVALDRPVAMVRDNHTKDLPFDTAMVNYHRYDASMNVRSVEQEIPKLQAFIEGARAEDRNPIWKYFGITQRAERSDTGSPEDAKFDIIMAEIAQLRAGHDMSAHRSSNLFTGMATLDSPVLQDPVKDEANAVWLQGKVKEIRQDLTYVRKSGSSYLITASGELDPTTSQKLERVVATVDPTYFEIEVLNMRTKSIKQLYSDQPPF